MCQVKRLHVAGEHRLWKVRRPNVAQVAQKKTSCCRPHHVEDHMCQIRGHLVCTPHFYAYLSYKLTNKPQGLGTEIKLIKLLFLLYFVLVSIINELN